MSAATYCVVDVETTGLDPKSDRIVEVACLRVCDGHIVERFTSLIDPQRPIPPAASAIHRIADCDVSGAPTLAAVAHRIVAMTTDAIVVAHNARFDMAFLPFLGARPTLCTLQLARRLVEAPNYRNATLRKVLHLDIGGAEKAAHRAEADAEVTVALLLELLRRYERAAYDCTLSALFDALARPKHVERFAFGRYFGQCITTVPSSYLRWILMADFGNWPDVPHTAELELRRREAVVARRDAMRARGDEAFATARFASSR